MYHYEFFTPIAALPNGRGTLPKSDYLDVLSHCPPNDYPVSAPSAVEDCLLNEALFLPENRRSLS